MEKLTAFERHVQQLTEEGMPLQEAMSFTARTYPQWYEDYRRGFQEEVLTEDEQIKKASAAKTNADAVEFYVEQFRRKNPKATKAELYHLVATTYPTLWKLYRDTN